MPTPCFDHEKLHVYQEALGFLAWSELLLQRLPRTPAVHNQLDRARTSIPLNIAEGNGKFTAPDRCRYFDSARGSALECAACLDFLFRQQGINETELADGKARLQRIVAMLVGLTKATSPDRLHEEPAEYRVGS